MANPVLNGFIVPGLPQPLLTPEANEGYARLRRAFEQVREEIARSEADVLIVYSTMWPSIVGHQIQALPEPEWVHVDELFHDLGSIPYKFQIDAELAEGICAAAHARNLNTGRPHHEEAEPQTATQTVLHDTDHPSHLALPAAWR